MDEPITYEELQAWQPWVDQYFLDILNGAYNLETAREDITSFRNTKNYTGEVEAFKTTNGSDNK